MNDNNVNKQCMEKILVHLTKLICLTEFEDIKNLSRLVDMSTSISSQLLALDEEYIQEDEEYIQESDD